MAAASSCAVALGQTQSLRLDPFLMLDEFSSSNADDYIAGFPDHPHRGFETVTYMLDGHMLHQDHLGNQGDLKSGGAQWMTAGRGIIHSEMPQQESGRMRGFQLWINLPAQEKMKPASYQDIQPEEIPRLNLPGGGEVKIIAGIAEIDGKTLTGPIQGISTEPLFLDVRLPAGGHFKHSINTGHNAFVYPYEGRVEIGPAKSEASAGSPIGWRTFHRRLHRNPGRRPVCGISVTGCPPITRADCSVRAFCDEYAGRDRAGDG